jgi:hypothetical protein
MQASVELVACGMPLIGQKTLRFTNASTTFAALAVEGCTSDENYDVLEKHIKEMRSEFEEIKKRKMANRHNTGATKGGATEGAQDPGATEHWSRCFYFNWTFTVNCRFKN